MSQPFFVSFREFVRIAMPPEALAGERSRGLAWKLNRAAGLRAAYLCYVLGLSANALSLLRLPMALAGLAAIFFARAPQAILAGVAILWWQVNLDFADGPVARARGESSPLGATLDGVANDVARAGTLACLALLQDSVLQVLAAVFAAQILVVLLPTVQLHARRLRGDRPLARWLGRFVGVLALVVCVPAAIAATRVVGGPASGVAAVVLAIYVLAAAGVLLAATLPYQGERP